MRTINANLGTFEREEQNEIAVKVVIGGLMQELSSNLSPRDLLQVPAKLEMKERVVHFLLRLKTKSISRMVMSKGNLHQINQLSFKVVVELIMLFLTLIN